MDPLVFENLANDGAIDSATKAKLTILASKFNFWNKNSKTIHQSQRAAYVESIIHIAQELQSESNLDLEYLSKVLDIENHLFLEKQKFLIDAQKEAKSLSFSNRIWDVEYKKKYFEGIYSGLKSTKVQNEKITQLMPLFLEDLILDLDNLLSSDDLDYLNTVYTESEDAEKANNEAKICIEKLSPVKAHIVHKLKETFCENGILPKNLTLIISTSVIRHFKRLSSIKGILFPLSVSIH